MGAASGASPLQAVSGGERFPVPMWRLTHVAILTQSHSGIKYATAAVKPERIQHEY